MGLKLRRFHGQTICKVDRSILFESTRCRFKSLTDLTPEHHAYRLCTTTVTCNYDYFKPKMLNFSLSFNNLLESVQIYVFVIHFLKSRKLNVN